MANGDTQAPRFLDELYFRHLDPPRYDPGAGDSEDESWYTRFVNWKEKAEADLNQWGHEGGYGDLWSEIIATPPQREGASRFEQVLTAPPAAVNWALRGVGDAAGWLFGDPNAPQEPQQFGPGSPIVGNLGMGDFFGPDAMGMSPGLIESQLAEGMMFNPETNRWEPAPQTDWSTTEGRGVPGGFGVPPLGQQQGALGLGADWSEQSQLADLYAEFFGGMRDEANAAYDLAVGEDPHMANLQMAYLDALGGGGGGTYFDDRQTRTVSYLDDWEQQVLGDIMEMDKLARQGITGAAVRQRELLNELEVVRSQRLQADQQYMTDRLAGLETERLANEQMVMADIAQRGLGRLDVHGARMGAAEDRLRGMGIDPSSMPPDETLGLLEAQADRQRVFSERIAAAEAGDAIDRDLQLQNTFGSARRSLEDQLFAGRGAANEREQQLLQALSETTLGLQQGTELSRLTQGFAAEEEAAAGKYEAGQAGQANTVRRALAELGFAEADADRLTDAAATRDAILQAVDLSEFELEAGDLTTRAGEKRAGAQLGTIAESLLGAGSGDPTTEALSAAALDSIFGGSAFSQDFTGGQVDAQAAEERAQIASVVGMYLAPDTGLPAEVIALALTEGFFDELTGQQSGVTLEKLMNGGVTLQQIGNIFKDNQVAFQALQPGDVLTGIAGHIGQTEAR